MPDEERVVVKTTVPKYQKDHWVDQADDLGMTQAEFIRTMVQAGRRDFELKPLETGSPAAPPRGDGLEDHVLGVLSAEAFVTFDEIVGPLIEDIEDQVDDFLQSLRDEKRVEHKAKINGYKLNGAPDGDD